MDNRNSIGVVTVTYNSASVLAAFMESLLKQTYTEFVLYVVDNASSDETLRRLLEYRDSRLTIVRSRTNVGVAEGNNIGIRAALKDGCASILLINNDTSFECDLLSKLNETLQSEKYDMVVPKILFFDDPERIWSAGGCFSRLRGLSKHFGFGRKDDRRFNRPRIVTYSPTCCMLIKKEVFERVGLMDANYFVYFDDTDFCYRAYRAGIRLYYLPSARLLHKVSTLTGAGGGDFAIRYCTRNHVYFLLKNVPRWQIPLNLLCAQVYLLGKFILVTRRLRDIRIAEKAFCEGISLFCSRGQRIESAIEGVKTQREFTAPS